MKKMLSLALSAALLTTGLVPAAADARDRYNHGDRYHGYQRHGYGAHYPGPRYRGGYYGRAYRGGYAYRGHGYCRDKGNGGTVIGAIAGGLLGNSVAGRGGDRTLGTIVGAGVGAVAGRAIDRDC